MPYESIPPMIIISVGVAGMGALQYGFHKLISEDWKPKRAGLRNGSGMDMFDWQLAKRDEQMKEAVELASQKGVKGEPWAYWKAFHEAEAAAHH